MNDSIKPVDILAHNREAWNKESAKGNKWTIPVDHAAIEAARRGEWSVLLTPTIPVPRDWFGDMRGKRVLCLASGGGQQAPIFAAAGARVTLIDNSPYQLNADRHVAEREGLTLRLEQGDMRDLSRFADSSFDLIFHPVSNIFVDNVRIVWKECARVLEVGGSLLAGIMNPFLNIFDLEKVDRTGEVEVRYKIPYSDLEQLPPDQLKAKIDSGEPLEFAHSLDDQIGGQIAVGFSIEGFFEDISGWDFLDDTISTFIATKAVRRR